jgi:DNA-binding Xre family transcriptional regulator
MVNIGRRCIDLLTETVTASRYTNHMIRSELRVYLANRALDQKRRPYSVREVAKGAGVAPSIVQGVMADNFKRIDRTTIDRICNYLECQPGDWLKWRKDEEQKPNA